MFIFHIALQGCLKRPPIAYGCTADTGGHIKYLLELVDESSAREEVDKIEIATRMFEGENLDPVYSQEREFYDSKTDIVRIKGATLQYLSKEELWREHDAFIANTIAYLKGLSRKPDVIHAHYADAGLVAAHVKSALGIPYIFTGHSLGRVKLETLRYDGEPDKATLSELEKRIAIEEEAIAHADGIIVSSRDEAEGQYPLYRNHRVEKITINPPGCELEAFRSTEGEPLPSSLLAEVNKFLKQPDKPPVLALARPVRKKNLEGLVKAYGESRQLQDEANLVIFAGTRDDIRNEAPENRQVLQDLLYLVDLYDLHGKVALPKSHEPGHVPFIYRYATLMGGVFVNPAYNEPFGLTLLEAAASGVPVVATNSGGPNDILERCGNGLLIDPHDEEMIADRIHALVSDRRRWEELSGAGVNNSGYFSWTRHVDDYLVYLGRITAPQGEIRVASQLRTGLLATDIDNTLVGDGEGVRRFSDWQARQSGYHYAVATGRSLHSALRVLDQWQAPLPDILVTSVGTEIYYTNAAGLFEADERWRETIAQGWDGQLVSEALAGVEGLVPQSGIEQRDFKLSYFMRDDPTILAAVRQRLEEAGVPVSVIYSHGKYLDILPASASKGKAISFLTAELDIAPRNVVAAGDSGNDADMLESVQNPVIVGNHSPELEPLKRHPRAYFAKGEYANGLLEGLERHQGKRPERPGGQGLEESGKMKGGGQQ